jgi:IS30 family transposase
MLPAEEPVCSVVTTVVTLRRVVSLYTERPEIVNKRGRIGDWEGDTVLGSSNTALHGTEEW